MVCLLLFGVMVVVAVAVAVAVVVAVAVAVVAVAGGCCWRVHMYLLKKKMNQTKKTKQIGSTPQGHCHHTPVPQCSQSLSLCVPVLSALSLSLLLLCLSCSLLCSLLLCLSFSWLFRPPHPRPACICVLHCCAHPSRNCSCPACSCLLCRHSCCHCACPAHGRPLLWLLWLCLLLGWWREGVGWCAKGWWWW
jgi:hypothetical protein